MMDDNYKKGLENLGYLLYRDVREPEQANFAWWVLKRLHEKNGLGCNLEAALYTAVCNLGERNDGTE